MCFACNYVETEEREYKPLETIKDNFPKYILTRSDPIQHRNGIIHKNMPELMKNGELFQMTDLTPIQKEIVTALEQMKEKSLITEANLAKKVRENAKISGKNKAGICLKDLEVCIEYLGENNQLPYALHLNSANDILIKKEAVWKLLDGDAKKRRQSSEKSISVLTNRDLRQKASGGKVAKKRNDRKKMSFRDVEEFE